MIALKDVLSSEFVERVHAFFSKSGPLSKARNFEFRPQQQEMAAPVAKRQGTFHRTRGKRIGATCRMGKHDPRWIAQRFIGGTRSKGLDAGLQRSAPLHSEDLRPKSALLLPASPQTFAGR